MGDPSFTVPTVGLNVKSVKKGGVSMKVGNEMKNNRFGILVDKCNIDLNGGIMLKDVMP